MFVVHNYRDNILRDTGYYSVSDYSIALYGKALMPLLWTPDSQCFSKQTKKIFSILDFRNEWNCRDSVIGDSFPSLILDPSDPSGLKFVNSKTAIILHIEAQRNDLAKEFYENKPYKMLNVVFDAKRVLRILKPENVQFPRIDGYEYFDNDRAVIGNKLILNLQFVKGIGIIYSYEKAWLQYDFCQTRTLLRYNVK